MGLINAGTAVGAMVAPPLIAVVLGVTNWRWIFLLAGAFGLLWTAWWQWSYRPASEISRETRNAANEMVGLHAKAAVRFPWTHLFRVRETWGLVTAKFLSDAAWFFYLFWLPKYLYDARGFDIKSVGLFAWMPNAAAGIGCLFGGSFSSYLVRRQFPVGLSRKAALGVSAAVMPFAILLPHVTVPWALTIFCLAYFGQQSWSTLVMVLPTDLFPQQVVGSVAGLVGFGGAMGGIVFGQLAGYLLDHGFGYGSIFAIAGTLHVSALLIILTVIPVVRPLELRQRLSYGRGQ
jgi:MFS transporter, ACS family, aldohexuronate transporter